MGILKLSEDQQKFMTKINELHTYMKTPPPDLPSFVTELRKKGEEYQKDRRDINYFGIDITNFEKKMSTIVNEYLFNSGFINFRTKPELLNKIKEIQEYINKNLNDNYDKIEIKYNDNIDKLLNNTKEYYDNNFKHLGNYEKTEPYTNVYHGEELQITKIVFKNGYVELEGANPIIQLYTKKEQSAGKKSRRRTTRRKKVNHKKKTNRRRIH